MGSYINPPTDGFEAVLKSNQYVSKSGIIAYTNYVIDSERILPVSAGRVILVAYYSKGTDSWR